MIIRTQDQSIPAQSILGEGNSIRVVLDGPVTAEQLKALQSGALDIDAGYTAYSGYTRLIEHSVVLARPDVDEMADMKAALEKLGVKKGRTWVDGAKSISSTNDKSGGVK